MGESKKSFRFNLNETVPTYTIGAAFTLSVVMGAMLVSGVLLKPYEARQVVENIHERIMMEKEYRELSKIKYAPNKVAFSTMTESAFPESTILPKRSSEIVLPEKLSAGTFSGKTERAHSFDRDVKSDQYWANLQASVESVDTMMPGSAPVVLPPVVVSSID